MQIKKKNALSHFKWLNEKRPISAGNSPESQNIADGNTKLYNYCGKLPMSCMDMEM